MRIAGVLLVRQSCCWSSSYRTHLVGDLIDRVGQCVRLCGWLNHRRQGRFGVVGDHSGCVQFYADPGHTANYSEFTKTSLQSCISVAGTVERRPLKDQRMSGSLDLLEVRADHFKVINACRHPIPFNPSASLPSEQTRQRFRLFDLRSPETQSVLRARSSFLRSVRDFFYDHNFTEIETPVLTTTASESGANEFKCKSTKTNACYVLAQSPQIYKQMLMIGCFDRYFQVAKCFRDEQVTSLRQPEFTQIDFEMAFADTNQILALGEDLVKSTLHSITKNEIRFDQMTYDEALSQYGTDKPDLRMNISTDSTSWTKVSGGSELNVDEIEAEIVSTINGLEMIVSQNKRAIEIKSDSTSSISRLNDRLRQYKNSQLRFVWITSMPLFEKSDDGSLKSAHHPFTLPINLSPGDVLSLRAHSFDLVLNGVEIGSGSQRIHDAQLQREIIENYLRIDVTKFTHLLKALELGAPPHAGMAIGLDRLIQITQNQQSVRSVSAFTKSAGGNESFC